MSDSLKKAENKSASGGNYFSSIFGGMDSNKPATKTENDPNDIPKEELLHLCMKLNKRMQAMESKGQELVKKQKQLVQDRNLLLDLLRASISDPGFASNNDVVDIDTVKDAWLHQLNSEKSHVLDLEDKLRSLKHEHQSEVSALKAELRARDKDSGPGNMSATSDQVSTVSSEQLDELRDELERSQKECESLRAEVDSLREENDKFRGTERSLRSTIHNLEVSVEEKVGQIEELEKQLEAEKTGREEDLVFYKMQQMKVDKEKEVLAAKETTSAAQTAMVESLKSEIKELTSAHQLMKEECEKAKDKVRELERNNNAGALLKAEQEALLGALRKDLKSALASKEELSRRVKDLEEYRVRAEGQLVRMVENKEHLAEAETKLDEANSLVTRLQNQLSTAETNHALRTAMLATVESELESVREELNEKTKAMEEAVERVTALQATISEGEARLEERIREHNAMKDEMSKTISDLKSNHETELKVLKESTSKQIEEAQAECAKKSAAARVLVSERDEEIRLLKDKVDKLQEEIASGRPSERKIFELAQSQASREASIGASKDTRELAFQQLQTALAAKDLDLARLQQNHTRAVGELSELRRMARREGVNMDYLKNVVLQYMSFPAASTEKDALVPVLALLLQFSAAELKQVEEASKTPWTSRPVKDVKLHPKPLTKSVANNNSSTELSAEYSPPPLQDNEV